MPIALQELRHRIQMSDGSDFAELALAVFALQRVENAVYADYLRLIGKTDWQPSDWTEIPALPIELFKRHDLRTGDWIPETTFRSSGTTGTDTSHHSVRDLERYRAMARQTFERQIGQLAGYRLLALLPNYLERGDSGLVAMIDDFMRVAAVGSGYFLHDHAALRASLAVAHRDHQPVMLWGVTFALLDLAAKGGELVLPKGSLVMETGGMKGRGPELTRTQLHDLLEQTFYAPIWSEYGMTELSSQAYRQPGQGFLASRSMRVRVRDLSDPFHLLPVGAQGALNVYDLANLDTCAFIATEDLGRLAADETFEVLGRVDRSVVRGCNLLLN